MTPAIRLLEKSAIEHWLHPYEHDPASRSYGIEAAEKIGVTPTRVFKTLLVSCDRSVLAVAVIPVSSQLDLKRFAAARGVKKVAMADATDAERATGYVRGGISPLGQKRSLATVIDRSINDFDTVYVSAGKRGLDVSLRPCDLIRLTAADVAAICQACRTH